MTSTPTSCFELANQATAHANHRLISSFPNKDTTLMQRVVNRTDRLKNTRTVIGFSVHCQGYSDPFMGRDPNRAVDKLMKMAGITRVQEYINLKGVQA